MIEVSGFLIVLVIAILCIPGAYKFVNRFRDDVPNYYILWACASMVTGIILWIVVIVTILADNIKII